MASPVPVVKAVGSDLHISVPKNSKTNIIITPNDFPQPNALSPAKKNKGSSIDITVTNTDNQLGLTVVKVNTKGVQQSFINMNTSKWKKNFRHYLKEIKTIKERF